MIPSCPESGKRIAHVDESSIASVNSKGFLDAGLVSLICRTVIAANEL